MNLLDSIPCDPQVEPFLGVVPFLVPWLAVDDMATPIYELYHSGFWARLEKQPTLYVCWGGDGVVIWGLLSN